MDFHMLVKIQELDFPIHCELVNVLAEYLLFNNYVWSLEADWQSSAF